MTSLVIQGTLCSAMLPLKPERCFFNLSGWKVRP